NMEPGRGKVRLLVQHVYVHSFGSHRCGSIIRYGKGCQQAERDGAGSLLSPQSLTNRTRGRRAARMMKDEADPGPTTAADEVQAAGGYVFAQTFLYASLRKFIFFFQSKVWLKVWKVISKMLEENEKFRHRLLTCSQLNGEGK
uniref:Uncharacterized protein n=1 Tax=Coturnix japonica TaxID=93934 RepID=A0A8C2T8M2_COTJA